MTIDRRHHLRWRGLGTCLEFLEARRVLSEQIVVVETFTSASTAPDSSTTSNDFIVQVVSQAAVVSELGAILSAASPTTGGLAPFIEAMPVAVPDVGTERGESPVEHGAPSVVPSPAFVSSGSEPAESAESGASLSVRSMSPTALLQTGYEESFGRAPLKEAPAAHTGPPASKSGADLLGSKTFEENELTMVSSRDDFVARGALTGPPAAASVVANSMTPHSRDPVGRIGGESRLNLVPESDTVAATVTSLTKGAIWTANAANTLRLGMAGPDAASVWQGFLPAPVIMSLSSAAGTAASLVNGEFEALRGLEVSASRGSEMLGAFSPFDRASLEERFDEFLQGIYELDLELPSLNETTTIVPGLVVAALTFSLAEATRRKVKRAWDCPSVTHVIDEDSSLPGLPGLPGGWDSEVP